MLNKFIRKPMTELEKKQQIEKSNKKYCRMTQFGLALPKIREDIHHYLDNYDNSPESVIAIVLSIIDLCSFRIGNLKYFKSTGITTLKKHHISDILSNTKDMLIEFKGKRQVTNHCLIDNNEIEKLLSTLVANKSPDEFVFTYNHSNTRISSSQINEFLQTYSPDISVKDFRTWKANVSFLKHIQSLPLSNIETNIKHNITKAVALTAGDLYHSPAICRKSYIDKRIIQLYYEQPSSIINKKNTLSGGKPNGYLSYQEIQLLDIFKNIC